MVPSGATADDLTTEDTESDGQILRTYSFGGTQVGTAVVEDSSQESSSDVLENDENMDSAKAYSESRSQIPYFAIGGVGILLLILLLWRMIRIIRSRSWFPGKYISESKNPYYVPVISGYIEGIFFCHLTHRGVSHKTELPGRYSIKTAKQPKVLSGPGISKF